MNVLMAMIIFLSGYASYFIFELILRIIKHYKIKNNDYCFKGKINGKKYNDIVEFYNEVKKLTDQEIKNDK